MAQWVILGDSRNDAPLCVILFQAICWEGGVNEQSFSSHVFQPDSRLSLFFVMKAIPLQRLKPFWVSGFPCAVFSPWQALYSNTYKMKLSAVTGCSFCLQVLLFCCFTAHVHTGLCRINLLFQYLIKVSVPPSPESKVISH